jgi:hypothetical protein
MFDSILHPENDALNILKTDHDKVKDLFSEFRDKSRKRAKREIIAEAIRELRVHALIEEEIFYPTVRPRLAKAMMNEANEEHHVAKMLIAELLAMTGEEEHYDAKFTVLSENIEHHIKEEERDMFPDVRALDLDLTRLGEKLLARKKDLMKNGIPASLEENRIAAIGVKRLDSPAENVEAFKTKKARVKHAALSGTTPTTKTRKRAS